MPEPSSFRQTLSLNLTGLISGLNSSIKEIYLTKFIFLLELYRLKSYKAALYLHNKVPGVFLPENILKRMEKAGEKAP